MLIGRLRTTSFRLPPEYFGTVFVYRPGVRYRAAWSALWRAMCPPGRDRYRLPDAGLRAALTVLSGDFVWMEPPTDGSLDWSLVSRQKLSPVQLRRALKAWEAVIRQDGPTGELGDAADDLSVEQVSVADLLIRRPGRCATVSATWVWKAATWEVAHRLAKEGLAYADGRSATLRLDSEACLLTWDDLCRAQDFRGRERAAMHVITPQLITIPGLEVPVVHLRSSLARLASTWGGWVKHAWVNTVPTAPLLYAELFTKRNENVDGGFETLWSDQAPEVLGRCDLTRVATPVAMDLERYDGVRGRLKMARSGSPIGSGVGQRFHEAVAIHAKRLLPEAVPLELVRASTKLGNADEPTAGGASVDAAIKTTGAERLHLTVLYAHDEFRSRVAKTLAEAFDFPAGVRAFADNDVETRVGCVSVVFRSPKDAAARLTDHAGILGLDRWSIAAVGREPRSGAVIRAALIETIDPDEIENRARDPKWPIRAALSAQGIVNQFVVHREAKGEDHAAKSAVWDLFRSAGIFPRPFATVDGIPAGTWLIGAHVIQPKGNNKLAGRGSKRGRHEGYAVCLVAAEAGSSRALGYHPSGEWRPLHEATAAFQAATHDHPRDRAAVLIEGAVDQLLNARPGSRAVLFLDAEGCRRLWPGLADKELGGPLPKCARADRVAVVRVRPNEKEVPRVAAAHDWPDDLAAGPGKPSTPNALFGIADEHFAGAQFYVSSSLTMDRNGGHRRHTRWTCTPEQLAENWHALTATELWATFPGPFAASALYRLSAVLCRQAPTWIGTLERPSPMHLARAIVRDHPAGEFREVVDEIGEAD